MQVVLIEKRQKVNIAKQLLQQVRFPQPTISVCTICTAMFGNGAKMFGTTATRVPLLMVRLGSRMEIKIKGRAGAVRGATRPRNCRSAFRIRVAPSARSTHFGFRVVCVAASGLP